MAFDQTQKTIRRLTIPNEIAREIWANAEHQSAVMQLAQRVDLGYGSKSIDVLAGNPIADWTVETGEKPVSNATLSLKTMTPYKLAVIETFSEEFVNQENAVYEELVRRLPAAIGAKLDATVFGGIAPGTGFDVLTGSTAVSIAAGQNTTVYDQLITVLQTIGTAGYDLNGFALSAQGQALILGATDSAGRPIFINSPITDGAAGQILGARVVKSQESYAAGTPNTIGYAGDFSKMRYGIVGDINIAVSRDASLSDGNGNILHMFQRDMVAVRCEAYVGVVVANAGAFVKLTD